MQRSKVKREHRTKIQYHRGRPRSPLWPEKNSNHYTIINNDEKDLTENMDLDDQPWLIKQKSTPASKQLQNWSTQGSLSRSPQGSFSSPLRSNKSSGHQLTTVSHIQEESGHEVSAILPSDFLLENVEQKVKQEPESISSAACEEEDITDLALFEDEVDDSQVDNQDDSQVDLPSSMEEDTSQYLFQRREAPLPEGSESHRTLFGTRKASPKGCSRGTEHVIKYAVNQFTRYHQEKTGKHIDMLTLSPKALNPLLLDFFKGVRKLDGGLPTAHTLKNLQSHLDRYLRTSGYPCSTVKDPRFLSCQLYVKARMEESNELGPSQRYIPVNEDDIEMMFKSNQLGAKNSETLLNTMWVLNSKYLGIKKPSEHYNLRWGDIVVGQDEQGQEYLQRRRSQKAMFPFKVYGRPDNPDRCFLSFFREFTARRPEAAMDSKYFFYLRINKHSQNRFYNSENMTVHQLGVLWRKMANDSGLPVNKKIL
ncbi:uncharacterized protein KIAA1958 homolog [Haliotis rubra]|uniref:uncharacterized protein KIAA1958 homolog n=1 Tax=Haliotis rubra TaxID=36100 RepID=UPI001EE51B94|nr:uncharacterized protein KIAA1958 homolog [Haliotis rubra]XP_046580267.1 uncharacterized protein KIAA1958 homolog [Haliotis rubra]XP_046580268.1 uncharacterized protein KIAA1958 homolog [Haliotis rubra]XP_046580269.1 uncharacterized protein KIAA1958 homolog [Haliotis rubra]